MTFTEKKFEIPELLGMSSESISEHLKLYAGYVKNANHIQETIKILQADQPHTSYQIQELHRRFSFEFNGIRNHEFYFDQFVGGAQPISTDSSLYKEIEAIWGSYDAWLSECTALCLTRGIGWMFMVRDSQSGALINTWVDEQHLGHLVGTTVILAIDMWEHSYLLDYLPSEKKKYVDAFFANLNFSVLEKRYDQYIGQI